VEQSDKQGSSTEEFRAFVETESAGCISFALETASQARRFAVSAIHTGAAPERGV